MLQVHVIESPGLQDITSGDRTGELLRDQLNLLRIPCRYSPIHAAGLLESRLAQSGPDHIIHLAAHGRDGGVGFTDGSFMDRNQLQKAILPYCGGKLVALDFCQSSQFSIDGTLARLLTQLTSGKFAPPVCVLTMFDAVAFADSVLSWGVFYRHLSKRLEKPGFGGCTPRIVYDSLVAVKGAQLHPMCAAYWYPRFGKFAQISPWKGEDAERAVRAIELGTPLP